MINFILRARRARTTFDINLDSLPKEGKLDTVCSSVSNALWVSGDIRRDTIIHCVLEGPPYGPKTITFAGGEMIGFRSDERSISLIIKEALRRGIDLMINEEAHVRKGVKIAKKSFERLVWELSQKGQMIKLDKNGEDIRKAQLSRNLVVILGDYLGLPPKTEKFLKDFGVKSVSIGPKLLFAAHCPIIVHNEIDRRYGYMENKNSCVSESLP